MIFTKDGFKKLKPKLKKIKGNKLKSGEYFETEFTNKNNKN